jgi:aspartokinase-like uncharacterized kinase
MSSTPSPRIEAAAPHLVAKIGGSLWSSPQAALWLAALRRFPFPLTLVPGGGPFADTVRKTQATMRFSDGAAHAMALLAMEQYALALADLDGTLALVSTIEDARAAHRAGRIALWRPYAMAHAASDIPASWDVTSDSLAAWYANSASASDLLLIKSVDVERHDDLVARGVVDRSFPLYAGHIRVFVAGPSSLSRAAEIFAQGRVAGVNMDANLARQKKAS